MDGIHLIDDPVLRRKLLSAYERIVAKCARYRPTSSNRSLRAEVARAIVASVRAGEVDADKIALDAFWSASSAKDDR